MSRTNKRPNHEQAIRDVIAEIGLCSTRTLARACLDRGLYGDDERERIFIHAVQADCRRALSAPTPSGLPFAGPTSQRDEDGAPLWVQPQFWTYEDCCVNLERRATGIKGEYQVYLHIHDYTIETFGKAPPRIDMQFKDEDPES